MQHTGGYGADVCVEGSGSAAGLVNALMSCRVFGRVLMLGNPHVDMNIPREIYDRFMRKEARILGCSTPSINSSPMMNGRTPPRPFNREN
ncbi:hypothetical protein [Sodalis ligni]|uniref:hypothetical protein n=1 Tax=Sodalis ligni TaxID=2697027 RepID=UPI002096B92B|nr:hypothetical protein [Sodalis ligni]